MPQKPRALGQIGGRHAGGLAAAGTYDGEQRPFGFAASSGYQEDGDTGLNLLGRRYYDPSTGRSLSRDPV